MLVFNKEHDLNKLSTELIVGAPFLAPIPAGEGFTPVSFIKSTGNEIQIRTINELTAEQVEIVSVIINAHDPTPNPQTPTAEERISALETLVLQQAGVI